MIDLLLIQKALIKFKESEITKNELYNKFAHTILFMNVSNPIMVSRYDLLKVLLKLKNKEISLQELVNWVNIIWFSEWFNYVHADSDCVASIMSNLEELDEPNKYLSSEKLEQYIYALENNIILD